MRIKYGQLFCINLSVSILNKRSLKASFLKRCAEDWKTEIDFSPKTNFKQFKVTFWSIGSKTA